jgi:hypothetical protein
MAALRLDVSRSADVGSASTRLGNDQGVHGREAQWQAIILTMIDAFWPLSKPPHNDLDALV